MMPGIQQQQHRLRKRSPSTISNSKRCNSSGSSSSSHEGISTSSRHSSQSDKNMILLRSTTIEELQNLVSETSESASSSSSTSVGFKITIDSGGSSHPRSELNKYTKQRTIENIVNDDDDDNNNNNTKSMNSATSTSYIPTTESLSKSFSFSSQNSSSEDTLLMRNCWSNGGTSSFLSTDYENDDNDHNINENNNELLVHINDDDRSTTTTSEQCRKSLFVRRYCQVANDFKQQAATISVNRMDERNLISFMNNKQYISKQQQQQQQQQPNNLGGIAVHSVSNFFSKRTGTCFWSSSNQRRIDEISPHQTTITSYEDSENNNNNNYRNNTHFDNSDDAPYSNEQQLFDDEDDVNLDCTNMDDMFHNKDHDDHDDIVKKFHTERKMTPLQEKWNALTMIPNPIFCMYYVLSAHHYWIHPMIMEQVRTSVDDWYNNDNDFVVSNDESATTSFASGILYSGYYTLFNTDEYGCFNNNNNQGYNNAVAATSDEVLSLDKLWSYFQPTLAALPPLTVVAVATGISLHAPFSFLYHWKYAIQVVNPIHHWSRRMDHAMIHVASMFLSYGTSGNIKYFLFTCMYNLNCCYKHIMDPVVKPFQNQIRVLLSMILNTIPLMFNNHHNSNGNDPTSSGSHSHEGVLLFIKMWVLNSTCAYLFAKYPVGGWSHSLFHIISFFLLPLYMAAACQLYIPSSVQQMQLAAQCIVRNEIEMNL